MNIKKIIYSICFVVLIFGSVISSMALANAPTNNLAGNVVVTFQNAAAQWQPTIIGYAQRLFWLLALADFAWMLIVLALKNGDFYDLVFNLVRKVLFLGFFYAVLINGNQWMMDIIDSFRTIASNVPGGAGSITPGAILESSFDVFMTACQELSVMSPQSWVIAVAGIGVVILGALMTAVQVLVLVEMYLAIIAGQITLGFGGSEWSKDYAVSFIKYIISVGLKLMVIQLLSAMANNMFSSWSNIPEDQFNLETVGVLMVSMLLLYAIMKTIPEIISGIISGGQFGSNPVSVLGTAAAVGAGAVAAGAGFAAGMAGGSAKSMAVLREATKAPGNTGGIGGTIRTVAGASARNFADNISKPKVFRASTLGGTYANLVAARQEATKEQNK